MIKCFFLTLFLTSSLVTTSGAQTASEITKSINKVKRDTMYIYAESTTKDLKESYSNARALLEMQVGEWVRNQYPTEGIERCVVKAKDHFVQLDTRRGELYRAFVYVSKNEIIPISNKSEVSVIEVAPVSQPNHVNEDPAIIVSEKVPTQKETSVIELTSEEKLMKQIKSFFDVEPYIKGLKSKGLLKQYGKYATMPEGEDCYLYIYDKQGNISAILRKSGFKQYNLSTLKEDNVKNYKNCGAIWFQLK